MFSLPARRSTSTLGRGHALPWCTAASKRDKKMEILERSTYVGPSHYAHFPVIRLELDLGPLEEWPTRRLGDDFIQALLDALPGLKEHGCSYGVAGGFVRRMTEDEGTW